MTARDTPCAGLLIRPLLAITRQIRPVSRFTTANKALITSWVSCSSRFGACGRLLVRALLAVGGVGSPRRVFRLFSTCGATHSR